MKIPKKDMASSLESRESKTWFNRNFDEISKSSGELEANQSSKKSDSQSDKDGKLLIFQTQLCKFLGKPKKKTKTPKPTRKRDLKELRKNKEEATISSLVKEVRISKNY